jgi:hypothetical protein
MSEREPSIACASCGGTGYVPVYRKVGNGMAERWVRVRTGDGPCLDCAARRLKPAPR